MPIYIYKYLYRRDMYMCLYIYTYVHTHIYTHTYSSYIHMKMTKYPTLSLTHVTYGTHHNILILIRIRMIESDIYL